MHEGPENYFPSPLVLMQPLQAALLWFLFPCLSTSVILNKEAIGGHEGNLQ